MHKFKKQFGQNFIKNPKYTSILVDFLDLSEKDTVIEIGPGDGAVTKRLLDSKAKVISIEVDIDLVPILTERFKEYSNFTLINSSILDVNIEELIESQKEVGNLKVAGALPYNISKKIIDLFFKYTASNPKYRLEKCSFIVQEEVAKAYSATAPNATFLSNYARVFSKVRKLESIPNTMFYPKPKVNGGILTFEFNKEIESNWQDLCKFIRIGFSSPRKTLLNNLKASKKYTAESLVEAFRNLSISNTARASELSVEIWENLFKNSKSIDL